MLKMQTLASSKLFAALLAIPGIRVVPSSSTSFALVQWNAFAGAVPGNFRRYNSRGDSDNRVADHHQHRRKRLTKRGFWTEISVAHRRESNNRPVNTLGDARKRRVFLAPLDDVHEGSHDDGSGDHEEEKDGYLLPTRPHRAEKLIGTGHVARKLENAKHPQEPKGSNHEKRTRTDVEQPQVLRNDGDQVNDPKEAPHVAKTMLGDPDPGRILDGE